MKHTPTKSQVVILIVSLSLMGLGQIMLGLGKAFIDAQPVDLAHWLLLVGAVGTGAVVTQLSLGSVGRVARILILAGAIAFTGMSAIDFLLWALPSEATIDAALDNALNSPAIAFPFLWVGPSLFFVGLALLGLTWWRLSKWGVFFLISGTLVSGLGQASGQRWLIITSFALMLLGLIGIWQQITFRKTK